MSNVSDSFAAGDRTRVIEPIEPPLLRRLWQERRWLALALFGGMAVWAFWIYSGLPMICH
jgi:hypothetical protein